MDVGAFQTEQAIAAFDKYAAVTQLRVRVYTRDQRPITGSANGDPLAALFNRGREPDIVVQCVRRCLAAANLGGVIVEHGHGIAAIGVPFTMAHETLCVAVALYAVTAHPDTLQVERLARETAVPARDLWNTLRKRLPVPEYRLAQYGELLQIIGEILLTEYARGRQLEESLAGLKAADRSKDEFLAMLSHELRTPLNPILGWAHMLRLGHLDAAGTIQAGEAIERNVRAQAKLVNELLDISRIVVGKLSLDNQVVDLGLLLEAALESFRSAAQATGIQLMIALDRSLGRVSGDPERLSQIFSNLLSNALKFTPAGGRIDIHLRYVGSEAVITVSDSGCGIDPEVLPHIFERFRQADASITRAHGGLGLGLAIVRHLTELHGGMVRGESLGVGRGATFTVTLPLIDSWQEPGYELAASGEEKKNSPSMQNVRVLVVDDDADSREMLRTVLHQCGADVIVAASGREALQALDRAIPDVLVCDLGMPDMDGYVLMQQIRGRPADRGGRVPAIALTGYTTTEERDRAISAGFQRHLAKPVEPYDLARVVVTLLESGTH